ncbi:MAG: DUF2442 domain-containing protein [Acidobacteriaceae bacterium]
MSVSAINLDATAVDAAVDEDILRMVLADGRELAAPLEWFPRLRDATTAQRGNWRLIGRGQGIHWPEVDEDISVASLLRPSATRDATSASSVDDEAPIRQIPKLIVDLYRTVRKLNGLFPGRPFTPDGHLVGSIGEVVAAYAYELKLHRPSTCGFDGELGDGRTVEVKLTGGDQINISEQDSYADLLIVLRLVDGSRFEEIFSGAFPVDVVQAKKTNKRRFVSVTLSQLKKLERHELSCDRLAELNDLFGECL